MRGSKVLIEHGTAQISDAHKVGIIGRNGCGKSSLFAAILGDLAPELGSINVPKNIKIAYVEQQTPALDISALDYVMQGDKEVMRLFEDKKNATLSPSRNSPICRMKNTRRQSVKITRSESTS